MKRILAAVLLLAAVGTASAADKFEYTFNNTSKNAVWVTIYYSGIGGITKHIDKAFCVEGGTTRKFRANYYGPSPVLFERKAAKDSCAVHSNIATQRGDLANNAVVTITDYQFNWKN